MKILDPVHAALRRYTQVRQERKQDKDLAAELEPRQIPRPFRNANASEFRWTSPSFMMASFQKLILAVRNQDARKLIVNELTVLTSDSEDKVEEIYLLNHLIYTIYREVKGEPYCQPELASLKTKDDIDNQNFFELIGKAVGTYKKATPETRAEFNKAVLPNVKKRNVAIFGFLQHTR